MTNQLIPFGVDEEEKIDVRAIITDAFALDKATLEDTAGYRSLCMWRIARKLIVLTGMDCNQSRKLVNIMSQSENLDRWYSPNEFDTYLQRIKPELFTGYKDVVDILKDTPTPILPSQSIDIHQYIRTIDLISTGLGIWQGSKRNKMSGRLGMKGLLNPEYLLHPKVLPTPLELIQIEELLVKETLKLTITKGRIQAQRYLTRQYGMSEPETHLLTSIALADAKANYLSRDLDEARTIQILRLEDFVYRAYESGSLRQELNGIKHLSTIQGITAIEPEKGMDKMLESVRRIINKEATPEAKGNKQGALNRAKEILDAPDPEFIDAVVTEVA